MRQLSLIFLLTVIGGLAACQSRPGLSGNVGGNRQPTVEARTIAEQSRAVQGGSFGNR